MILRCAICSEPVRPADAGSLAWEHTHSGEPECFTGDGSTAHPPEKDREINNDNEEDRR